VNRPDPQPLHPWLMIAWTILAMVSVWWLANPYHR
jgi:hypothetical protein